MIIKKSLLLSFLFVICHFNNYGHETNNISLECTGKIPKKRQPLFVIAEMHEHNLITARAQCLQTNDCDINPEFKHARYEVLHSIDMLMDHLEELKKEKSSTCSVCEKNETIALKNRLLELLQSIQ